MFGSNCYHHGFLGNLEDLCTHFMYGFVFVQAGGANGGYMLKSNDPNADHPSGHEAQDGLCPEVCLLVFQVRWFEVCRWIIS